MILPQLPYTKIATKPPYAEIHISSSPVLGPDYPEIGAGNNKPSREHWEKHRHSSLGHGLGGLSISRVYISGAYVCIFHVNTPTQLPLLV